MANHEDVQLHAEAHAPEHETSDVNVRGILAFVAALLAVAIAVHLLIGLLFLYFAGREARPAEAAYPLAAAEGTREPPAPRLQVTPRQDMRELRAREDGVLRSYGWVDRSGGIVRIPIDEAMRLTVERGLPARGAAAP
ncbi:MAG: hypothetical protein IT176_08090 [Acidobacteria bacterium]|nr:hypothetical protein [Acidobacteriota bacterium]